ncbi:MAG: sigma-70 family RNA polymerase sigma factor [Gemmataceae bacterium]|nr:sigma-70 family RNA polymerase sigma factor [Gemmataceae bacterium]MDW8241791.1 sigma-70 family RNA polymerase sigma factor [Thermogemmata sp.]
MPSLLTSATQRVSRLPGLPAYVFHPSFRDKGATQRYDPRPLLADVSDTQQPYMVDEQTREFARRMHYAAYRAHRATTVAGREQWLTAYYQLRDRIVLGNRKLIFRAVRRHVIATAYTDDFVSDCHIVLIQAVAAFNPWLNIRFSTYAYTCLARALSRQSQRMASDCLTQALSFDSLPHGEPNVAAQGSPAPTDAHPAVRLDEYLRHDHPLLTQREKAILKLRFGWSDEGSNPTLEQVGRQVGLSKERVRQVQAIAINKLRAALIAR